MASPELAAPSRVGSVVRLIALVAVLVTLVVNTYLSMRSERAEKSSESAQTAMEISLQARLLYLQKRLIAESGTSFGGNASTGARLLKDVRELAAKTASPENVRRAAIIQYVAGDPGWKQTLLRLRTMPQAGRPMDVDRELAMWRLVLDGHPKAVQTDALRRQIGGLRLGWYEYPALEAMYHNAGLEERASQERTRALRAPVLLMAFLYAALAAVGLGALLGLVVVLWLSTRRLHTTPLPRVLEPTPPEPLARSRADTLYTVFIVYLALFAVLRLVLSGFLARWLDRDSLGPTSATLLSVGMSMVHIGLTLLVLALLGRRVGLRAADFGWRSRRPVIDILWGIGGYLMGLPLIIIVGYLSTVIFRSYNTPTNPAITQFMSAPGVLLKLLIFFEAAMLAPFTEETMFRGVFFRALSGHMGRIAALLVASGVFAALHPQLPLGFLAIFVLGALFNVLYLMRGSLVPNMVAHAINNAAIVMLLGLAMGS